MIEQRLAALRAQQAIDRQTLLDHQAQTLQALRDGGDSAEEIAALQQSTKGALNTFKRQREFRSHLFVPPAVPKADLIPPGGVLKVTNEQRRRHRLCFL